MEEALTLDIQPTVYNNILIYIVQVVHQKYKGAAFSTVGSGYTAPNGFRLSSQAVPALYTIGKRTHRISIKGELISGMWESDKHMMCVRGGNVNSDNSRMYTDSIVYITKLKEAVASYNALLL